MSCCSLALLLVVLLIPEPHQTLQPQGQSEATRQVMWAKYAERRQDTLRHLLLDSTAKAGSHVSKRVALLLAYADPYSLNEFWSAILLCLLSLSKGFGLMCATGMCIGYVFDSKKQHMVDVRNVQGKIHHISNSVPLQTHHTHHFFTV